MIDNFEISTKNNLLAFSGGVDSTALFFLLLDKNIPFDIAIVNYSKREQSKQEVEYAKYLAYKYNKKCYIESVTLEQKNFEAKAREIRYDFFKTIIKKHAYEALITAHQLNDKFEWFLMQFSKGAGLYELIGMQIQSNYEDYILYRPLLNTPKSTLENYLKNNKYKYFYDESNKNFEHKRNYFRAIYCDNFIEEFSKGIEKSFYYLSKDLDSLNIINKPIYNFDKLDIFLSSKDDNINIRIIDINLKKRGYILSYNQRKEVLRQKECVIDKYAICITKKHIYIAPYDKNIKMTKIFKELCRVEKIPAKTRYYLFKKGIDPRSLTI